MLNQIELSQYVHSLDLNEAAFAQLQMIRSSEPVRRVQGRGANVRARYPSRKMGRVIQAESRTVELVAIRCAYEFEPMVLEYWDQPCQIELQYLARNGRRVCVQHTPDFFVLRQDSLGWEEWKPQAKLAQLAEKMPHRYRVNERGEWDCPPGKAYAEKLGFYYHLRTSSEFTPIYQRNIAFLEDYLGAERVESTQAALTAIVNFVTEQPGVTLAELQNCFPSDELFHAIAQRAIYTDLEAVPLVQSRQVFLFCTAELAMHMGKTAKSHQGGAIRDMTDLAAGTILLWDQRPWQIVNVGLTRIALWTNENEGRLVELCAEEVSCLVEAGRIVLPNVTSPPIDVATVERIRQASPAALARATERTRAVEALLAGQQPTHNYPKRTLREYKRRYLTEQSKGGSGFVGLLDKNHKKGNRCPRLSPESDTLLQHFITQSYETFKQKSVRCVYGEYLLTCEEQQVRAASYTTFSKRIHHRPPQEQVRKRQGARAAYQMGPESWWLAYDTPRHGDFPWQYGHIDHTQLNLEMVCAQSGRILGRPWLTLLLDAFSRRVLAIYITFDPPSYRSCMAVLVESVRRHQRLPQQIIVDNGSEFESIYFETMLAHYNITKLSRPIAQPRVGSLIERLFRTSETEFVHNLRGNTQIMKAARQVTKAVDPKHQAVWTLELFYEYFSIWSYQIYDQMPHTTLGQSPQDLYLVGLAERGLRHNRQVVYDETFRILMLPTTRRGQAKVIAGSGVKVNYLYYWSDVFRQPDVVGTVAPVRYDPFNAGIAYAYVKGLWERCISECYISFQGRTEREMAIATAELRRQKQLHRQHLDINAKTLASFLTSVEGQELVLEQQLKDSAARQIRTSIFGLPQQKPDDQPLWDKDAQDGACPPLPTQNRVKITDLEQYGDLVL